MPKPFDQRIGQPFRAEDIRHHGDGQTKLFQRIFRPGTDGGQVCLAEILRNRSILKRDLRPGGTGEDHTFRLLYPGGHVVWEGQLLEGDGRGEQRPETTCLCQPRRLLAPVLRPQDGYRPGSEILGQVHHIAHHQYGWRLHILFFCQPGDRLQGACDQSFFAAPALLDQGRRGLGVLATLDQRRYVIFQPGDAHQDHQSTVHPGENFPVQVLLFPRFLVAGHDRHRGGDATVSNRYPHPGGHRDGRGNPGHHLEGYTGLGQGQPLLAPSPEEVRITAF